MNSVLAKCGHSTAAIGAPGSPARIKSETSLCADCQPHFNDVWESDTGNVWTVVSVEGDYVRVLLAPRQSPSGKWDMNGDIFRWHVSSLIGAGMRRIKKGGES